MRLCGFALVFDNKLILIHVGSCLLLAMLTEQTSNGHWFCKDVFNIINKNSYYC